MNWTDVLSATHGVFFSSQDQVAAWEGIFRDEIPDLKKGEVEKALKEARSRNEQTVGYRMTAYDIVSWVKRSRRKWKENCFYKDGAIWFPDRERICGQMQQRPATLEEYERDFK